MSHESLSNEISFVSDLDDEKGEEVSLDSNRNLEKSNTVRIPAKLNELMQHKNRGITSSQEQSSVGVNFRNFKRVSQIADAHDS